jgi:hypothetical protein
MALEFGTSIIFTDPLAAEYGRVEASGEAASDIARKPAKAPWCGTLCNCSKGFPKSQRPRGNAENKKYGHSSVTVHIVRASAEVPLECVLERYTFNGHSRMDPAELLTIVGFCSFA